MAKQIYVELVGSVRNVQDDSFVDKKDGSVVAMTRVKLLTGTIEGKDEAIHDLNYIWKVGPNGKDIARPDFLKDVHAGKIHKLPARVTASVGDVTVKGV